MTATVRRNAWAVAATVYGLADLVWIATGWRSATPLAMLIDNGATVPISLAAAIAFYLASRHHAKDSRLATSLGLLALGMAFDAIGSTWFTEVAVVQHVNPGLSLAQVPFLAFYPPVFAAFLLLPRARRARLEWWKFTIDALTVLVASAVIVWYFTIGPLFTTEVLHDSYGAALAILFPTGDILLLFALTTIALRQPAGRRSSAFVLLFVGSLALIVSDLMYAILFAETGAGLPLPEAVSTIGFVAIVWSATRYVDAPPGMPERVEERATRAGLLNPYQLGSPLPYAAAAAVYVLALVAALRAWPSPLSGLVVAAAPVTLLLTARGLVAVRQNARLLTERAERAGEARLVALLDATTDLVAVSNAQGRITYLNRGGRQNARHR